MPPMMPSVRIFFLLATSPALDGAGVLLESVSPRSFDGDSTSTLGAAAGTEESSPLLQRGQQRPVSEQEEEDLRALNPRRQTLNPILQTLGTEESPASSQSDLELAEADGVPEAVPIPASQERPPLSIGVFGGSFNPIHLGHALLAITTQQTKSIDEVVLVPVFKHYIKTDLLPFEDRVAMAELAVRPYSSGGNSGVSVSTIEREVGESLWAGKQGDYGLIGRVSSAVLVPVFKH